MMNTMIKHAAAIFFTLGLMAQPAAAQTVPVSAVNPDSRMEDVDGHAMWVQTAGLASRSPGDPVVVFENGGMSPLESWGIVVAQVAAFAPVVAYDRSTIGRSQWDGEAGTPQHVTARLRALLETLGVDPPYVLVGWSWGGDLILHHAGVMSDDVAGLVLVDPALHSPAATFDVFRAVGAGDEAYAAWVAGMTGWFAALPPAGQAEGQPIGELFEQQVEHDFPPTPPVPTSVLLAGRYEPPPPDRIANLGEFVSDWREHHDASLRNRIDRAREWVLAAPEGQLVVTTSSSHAIQLQDPELVVDAIRRVVFPDIGVQLRQAMDEGFVAAYHALKGRYPPDRFNEWILNALGYELLGEERTEMAIAVFELNVEEYPNAWNPHDSLGDAYRAAGATERAIASYRRSLELNPDSPSARKLAVMEDQ